MVVPPTSQPSASPAEIAAPKPPPPEITTDDPKAILFREGLRIVMGLLSAPEAKARGLIGRWLKLAGNDAALVQDAICDAAIEGPIDPVPWITAALKARTPPNAESPRPAAAASAEAAPEYGPLWRAYRRRNRPWWASYAKRGRFMNEYGTMVDGWCYGTAAADGAENRVLEAAGLPWNWPGDMEPLARWLVEGWRLSVIERVIRSIAERSSYTPPRSLMFFDAAIRASPQKDSPY